VSGPGRIRQTPPLRASRLARPSRNHRAESQNARGLAPRHLSGTARSDRKDELRFDCRR